MNEGKGFDHSVSTASVQPIDARRWYLVQCKPRQDKRAEEHLVRQGYVCVRPKCIQQTLVGGRLHRDIDSLFPGYLFIQLSDECSWGPLRSTRGVGHIVGFGGKPAIVSDELVWRMQQRTEGLEIPLFIEGEAVRVVSGGFAEMDAIFKEMDGEKRVILLIGILNRRQCVSVPLTTIARH